jgi:hypothetical protein
MKKKFVKKPRNGCSTVSLGEKTISQAEWIAEILDHNSLSSVLRHCVSETYKRLKKKYPTPSDDITTA